MTVGWSCALRESKRKTKTILVPLLLVAVMLGALFQGVTAGSETGTTTIETPHDHGADHGSHGTNPLGGGQPEGPLGIGEYERNGIIEILTEDHVHDHPQGLRIRAPPASTMMWVEPWYLNHTMGGWATTSPFLIDEHGRVEIDRQNIIIHELTLSEESVFTLGSNTTLMFDHRPMWVNLTIDEEHLVLGMQDGDPQGQKIYLSKQFLHENEIHWPVVTHEDNITLDPRETEDRDGFWVNIPHFSNITIESSEFKILERRNGIVLPYQGTPQWDPETNDLWVDIAQKFSTVEILLEMAWFDAFMPYLGLKNHNWVEEEYEGHWYYTVQLEPSDTPTTLHFLQYRPVDSWVYTSGNPENLDMGPEPVMIEVQEDLDGTRVTIDTDTPHVYDVQVAKEWLDTFVEELPLFETDTTGDTWNTSVQSALPSGDWLLHFEGPVVFRVLDTLTGPLIMPDYQATEEGVVRNIDGCTQRHLVTIQNGTLAHEGAACLDTRRILDLVALANQSHWRYDSTVDGSVSAARTCAVLVETTIQGELYWAGSPCRDHVSPSGSNPGFLDSLCSSTSWSNRSHEAFCGDGLSRYQANGLHMNISDERASVMADLLLFNEGTMDDLNQMVSNETFLGEREWLRDVQIFLRWLRLDESCPEGSPFLQVKQVVPASVCGRAINEYIDGNQTVIVDMEELEAAWEVLFDSRPCGPRDRPIIWLKPSPQAYCGKQLPMIHDQVLTALEAVDWESECNGEPGLLTRTFGSNVTFSWLCGTALENPDLSHSVVLGTQGVVVQSVCFVDESGTQDYRVGDPVYLVFGACNGTVAASDLRLTGGSYQPGSKVRHIDQDWGDPYLEPTQSVGFRYHDNGGNGTPGPGDSYYLCIGDVVPCGGSVDLGWVRMAAFGVLPAGSVVDQGDPDLNLSVIQQGLLGELGEHFRYWDKNEDGVFNMEDVMYWTATGNPLNPSVGHVRLGAKTGTGGFGEVLESGMLDVVEGTWFEVANWDACEGEGPVLMDLNASLPERLCDAPIVGLEESLQFVLNFTNDRVVSEGLCPGHVPLFVMDQVPSVLCGEEVMVEDPQWGIYLNELQELNPCLGNTVVLDHQLIFDDLLVNPPVMFIELCGEEFEVLSEILGLLDSIEDCVDNDFVMSLAPTGLVKLCVAEVVVEDPEIPEVPSVPNPCGDQTKLFTGNDEAWSSVPNSRCGIFLPNLDGLLGSVENAVQLDICAGRDDLSQGQGEKMEVCGWSPDLDPALEEIAQIVVGENPCQEDLVVSWDLGTEELYGLCGGLIGELFEEIPSCDEIQLCSDLSELIEECINLACAGVDEVVDLVGNLIGSAGKVVDECLGIAAPTSSGIFGYFHIIDCIEVNRIIELTIEADIDPCEGLSCLDLPSSPSPAFLSTFVDPLGLTLEWDGGAASSADVTYTVYLDVVFPPQNVECIAVEVEYCGPLNLRFGSPYFWQVKQVWDDNVVVSPIWAFATDLESNGWFPTIDEDLFSDYPGKPNAEALCRKVADIHSLPGMHGPWTVYELCILGAILAYGMDDPDILLLAVLEQYYFSNPEEGPSGGPDGLGAPNGLASTVLMIRGLSASVSEIFDGAPNPTYGDWDKIEEYYSAGGYGVIKLDYYGDMGSDAVDVTGFGVTGEWFGGVHNYVHARTHGTGELVHGYNIDWRHLAYHLAWYIYKVHTSEDEWVDVVAHSMGGMMIRYAIQQSATPFPPEGCDNPSAGLEWRCLWPPYLLVENVATFGSPFRGAWTACLAFTGVAKNPNFYHDLKSKFWQIWHLCSWALSVKEFTHAAPPTTSWMVMGSWQDLAAAPVSSQVWIEGAFRVIHVRGGLFYCGAGYGHSDYYTDVDGSNVCQWHDEGYGWTWQMRAPRAVPLSYDFVSGSLV